MDMMEEFKQKFIEEADELISDLEKSLLILEKNPKDKEEIEKIFRVMHTLKGNGGMFGYFKISEFTHNLESIYDFVRNGEMKISTELLDITLNSVDHLKVLLASGDDLDEETQKAHNNFTSKIEKIITDKLVGKHGEYSLPKDIATPEFRKAKPLDDQFGTYYIYFMPNKYIFNNGTNPLFLLDEIHTLGNTKIFVHFDKVPDIDNIDFTLCYTWWEIFVFTSETEQNILDVFLFVEDDSEIEIRKISNIDLLNEKYFCEKIESASENNEQFNIDDLIKNTPEKKQIPDKPPDKIPESSVTKVKPKVKTAITSIRVSSEKIDQLMRLVSEMVTIQARLNLYTEKRNDPELTTISENVQKLSKQLRDNAFSISLIPIGSIITKFQRMVRDLSNELGKKINFVVEGQETELDKSIIESLSDPLMHILRNSIDHGIEDTETRVKNGKPKTGTIILKAYYSGSNVYIEVKDDGAGIDADKILQKAIDKKIVNENAVLSKKQIMDLIFLPGFSTAEAVSNLSGRGVGMDVVRKKISQIRGVAEVYSEYGKGTTMIIKLPLTLSIIDGLQVTINDTHYIIPLSSVYKIYSVNHSEIAKSFNDLIVLDSKQTPFFYLRKKFNFQGTCPEREEIVIVKFENRMVGLVIDKVIGEYQTVLKPLGRHYKDQEFISGGTILGDGTVALVLDSNKIVSVFSNQFIKPE